MIGLDQEKISSLLDDTDILVQTFQEIDSTNSYVKRLVNEDPEIQKLFVVAESQTQGRGRQEHSFFSPTGGLYMTLFLNTEHAIASIQKMTVAASVAAIEAIQEVSDTTCSIKWVNDIYLNEKKISGILCEAPRKSDGTLAGIVIGIGINVHKQSFPDDIKDKVGYLSETEIDRNRLAASFANHMNQWIDQIQSEDLMNQYRAHSFLIGRTVSFVRNKELLHGVVQTINDEGNLVIQLSTGAVISLFSGEVSLTDWQRSS